MNSADRLPPHVAPPALRLLERPCRPAPVAVSARQGFWRRWLEVLRRPR